MLIQGSSWFRVLLCECRWAIEPQYTWRDIVLQLKEGPRLECDSWWTPSRLFLYSFFLPPFDCVSG